MEKKFQNDKKKEDNKTEKVSRNVSGINNTSLERSEPYYALYSMKI